MRYLLPILGGLGIWAQTPRYPDNPYALLFTAVYGAHPLLPRGTLEAVAYTQSRFSPLEPSSACTGIPQGIGLFGWIANGKGYFRENLFTIATLAQLPVEELIKEPALQIEALARAFEARMQARRLSSTDWQALPAIFIDLGYLPLSADPVQDFAQQSELYEILRFLTDAEAGKKYHFTPWPLSLEQYFGENYAILSATMVKITEDEITTPDGHTWRTTQNTDYPGAIWDPAASCNYSSRNGAAITHVTIHTVQGTYAGCISWFKNCNAQASAHYVLRSSDGQITQMVREADKAWHVGSENPYTIGLEHEGYINNPTWYTVAMYQSSAALVRNICQRRSISRNSVWFGDACSGSTSACLVKSCIRIKGHQQYTNQTHTDPGPNWNWKYYYQLVAGPTYSVNQTFTTPTGTVYDPGGASGDYGNNQRYFIRIAPPGATSLTLTFQQFNLENNFSGSTKGGDYLYVYDGDTTTAPLLRRLTGSSLPNPITTTGGVALLELRTDCSTPMAGWQLTYNATFSGGTGSTDNTPPTTSIGPTPDWATQNFPLTFQDEDDGGRAVEKAFYLVLYDSSGDWRANAERGFFSDNFMGPTVHPDWTAEKGNWLVFDPGNGDPVLRQDDETSADAGNTNLYASLKQNLSNRYLYHWAGRFVGGTSTNRRMGLHIFADNPTATNRGNSYFVFFRLDGQKVQLYKVVNDSWGSGPVAQVDYTFQAGIWYDFKWSYDRITGDHRIYVNNQLVLSWKDSSPIASGDYISLRTGNAIAEYNNFKVYRSRPNSGTVTIRVGDGPADDLRRQSEHPAHYIGRIRSIAQDSAGNLSSTPARDVRVDWTPPTAPAYVRDGSDLLQDAETVQQDTVLAASWQMSEDPHSGIQGYQYCLATAPGQADVIAWTNTPGTSYLLEPLPAGTLQAGVRYYVGIRSINGAGLVGPATYSDGFIYQPLTSALGRDAALQAWIVPNPSSSAASLYVQHPSGGGQSYTVQVFSTIGQQVWEATGSVNAPLPLPTLSPGVYLVALKLADHAEPILLRWLVNGT